MTSDSLSNFSREKKQLLFFFRKTGKKKTILSENELVSRAPTFPGKKKIRYLWSIRINLYEDHYVLPTEVLANKSSVVSLIHNTSKNLLTFKFKENIV